MNTHPCHPRLPRRHFLASLAVLLPGLLLSPAPPLPAAPAPTGSLVYIGTYSGPNSKGIYGFRLDHATGALAPLGVMGEVKSPSFLALHPNGRFLYSISEVSSFDGKPAGGVSAFAINPTNGLLTLLNQQSSAGAGPCHLSVDQAGGCVLVANYGGGSVAALPLRADGSLEASTSFHQHIGSSVNPQRQKGPRAHAIYPSPDNRFALACDLGLDKVLVYRLDAPKGLLTPHEPAFATLPPGSGPRHLAWNPQGTLAYVINEMLCTVSAFGYDARLGRLELKQTLSVLPPGETVRTNDSTAEIVMHPRGRFLYGSIRGRDALVVFEVSPKDGTLKWIENVPAGGSTPRCFGVDPTGAFLIAAHQKSDSLAVFRIHPRTGRLTTVGATVAAPTPVCVTFRP